jgi:hypothetical protein
MKVWVVLEGCLYDGSGLVAVHATEEGAVEKAQELVNTASSMRDYQKVSIDDGVYTETHPREGDHCWRDGSLFIQVEGWEVTQP